MHDFSTSPQRHSVRANAAHANLSLPLARLRACALAAPPQLPDHRSAATLGAGASRRRRRASPPLSLPSKPPAALLPSCREARAAHAAPANPFLASARRYHTVLCRRKGNSVVRLGLPARGLAPRAAPCRAYHARCCASCCATDGMLEDWWLAGEWLRSSRLLPFRRLLAAAIA